MSVPQPFLPYALSRPSFLFRHLAMQAGLAPIGGAREVVLGCFMAARLAAEREPSGLELTEEARQVRAAAGRRGVGTLSIRAAERPGLPE
jgi:hypothetical protein